MGYWGKVLFYDGFAEYVHDDWIKLGAAESAKFSNSFFMGASCSVNPLITDGDVGVYNGQDSGSEWDILSRQTVGIARAIIFFMVGPDDRGYF